jgi:predicted RNA-binding protein with PIN domain
MRSQGGAEELDLLLIDGDNLLHEVRGTRDEGGVAWLLPRLSGWRPQHLRIIVGLDGHPPPGETSRKRVTRGIEFHHSRSRSADDMLIELLQGQPYAGRSRTAVVTRDRGLQARASRAGGATRSVDWLMNQVLGKPPPGRGRAKAVGIGQGKPPGERHVEPSDADALDREGWQPGRGATKKKGNPKRSAKGARQR